MRVSTGYGGERPRNAGQAGGGGASFLQGELGSFIVTCEGADLRLTADALLAYTTDGLRGIQPDPWRGMPGRGAVMDELLYAVSEGRPVVHDGRWEVRTVVCRSFGVSLLCPRTP